MGFLVGYFDCCMTMKIRTRLRLEPLPYKANSAVLRFLQLLCHIFECPACAQNLHMRRGGREGGREAHVATAAERTTVKVESTFPKRAACQPGQHGIGG